MFKDEPLLQEPGTKYTYTTFGYSVLGCVVEGASGQSSRLRPRERLQARRDGAHARRQRRRHHPQPRARVSAHRQGRATNSPLADNSYKVPGGGFVSTVEDLARFAVALQATSS